MWCRYSLEANVGTITVQVKKGTDIISFKAAKGTVVTIQSDEIISQQECVDGMQFTTTGSTTVTAVDSKAVMDSDGDVIEVIMSENKEASSAHVYSFLKMAVIGYIANIPYGTQFLVGCHLMGKFGSKTVNVSTGMWFPHTKVATFQHHMAEIRAGLHNNLPVKRKTPEVVAPVGPVKGKAPEVVAPVEPRRSKRKCGKRS
jgi:hypothetical protein